MEKLAKKTEKSPLPVVAIDGVTIKAIRESKKLTQLYVAPLVGDGEVCQEGQSLMVGPLFSASYSSARENLPSILCRKIDKKPVYKTE